MGANVFVDMRPRSGRDSSISSTIKQSKMSIGGYHKVVFKGIIKKTKTKQKNKTKNKKNNNNNNKKQRQQQQKTTTTKTKNHVHGRIQERGAWDAYPPGSHSFLMYLKKIYFHCVMFALMCSPSLKWYTLHEKNLDAHQFKE